MATKNRRVATYLPKELDDRLTIFIAERGLKGESSALITILSEFFGVSGKAPQGLDPENFVTKAEFLELSEKVLPKRSIDRLSAKLNKIEARISLLEADAKSESHLHQMTLYPK